MEQIVIRLPEDVASRLKAAAGARRVGVNKLVMNWIHRGLDEIDDEAGLRALAKRLDPSMASALRGHLNKFSQRAKDDRVAAQGRKWKAMREQGKAMMEAETSRGYLDQEGMTNCVGKAVKPRAPRSCRKKTDGGSLFGEE